MTADLPSEKQLAKELQLLCASIGYRAGTSGTEAIRDVPTLIGLVIVGGPSVPDGILEWRDRRNHLRAVLQDVIENEVKKELDERYADAATRIFRLNASQPLGVPEHVALGEIQAPLDEAFGSPPGSKAFQDDHRPLIFAVMAQALQVREKNAKGRKSTPNRRQKPSSDSRRRVLSPRRKAEAERRERRTLEERLAELQAADEAEKAAAAKHQKARASSAKAQDEGPSLFDLDFDPRKPSDVIALVIAVVIAIVLILTGVIPSSL